MLEFWLFLAIFLGAHMVILWVRLKLFLVSKIGKGNHLIAYPLAMVFAVFMLFSTDRMVLLDHKKQKDFGDKQWFEHARLTSVMLCSSQPFLSGKFKTTKQDVTGIILGLLVYMTFYSLHGSLFGVFPTPSSL